MVVLRFNTRILVVETYCVDGISYLGAHVMLSIVNDHLSNKWMKKNIQALYLITVHLKKRNCACVQGQGYCNLVEKKSDCDLDSLLPYQFETNLH